jgi:hypothetical protein
MTRWMSRIEELSFGSTRMRSGPARQLERRVQPVGRSSWLRLVVDARPLPSLSDTSFTDCERREFLYIARNLQPEVFGQPAPHDWIGRKIGQRVEQRLAPAALVELPEGVGPDDVVRFQQGEKLAGFGEAERFPRSAAQRLDSPVDPCFS